MEVADVPRLAQIARDHGLVSVIDVDGSVPREAGARKPLPRTVYGTSSLASG